MLRTNTEFLSYIDKLYQSNELEVSLYHFEKGKLLFHQGEPCHRVLVIKEGIVKCFFNEENGKDYIVEFLGRGEILGEIEAIRQMDGLCNVAALTEIKVYVLAVPFFRALLTKDLTLNKLLLEELAERIVNTSSRASFQQLYTVEHGLAKLLELQEKQGIAITKDDMAAYLGITLRSLNRALKDFSI
ncbi:Crp/Fnr family transcriptional regulator [Pedobacter sp. ASV28]|uniref:Crp/Fnr family transcriptional regulator n=1 Tax=Pedobacter sp. ASV28 TaxID=2795123 RepID=UPI0018EB15C7|nr:Crp/Fnr family transcriptional regulator [Pedobacter sp. ASV28]